MAMRQKDAQQQRQKIRGSGLKTPEMHASFECDAFEDGSQYEACTHKEAENWALAKGCADALRAPGSSRPRHNPKEAASFHKAPDDCQETCNQDELPPQMCCIDECNIGCPIPPEIRKVREEGLRRYSPLDYQMSPVPYPENNIFRAWGRKWLIKRSECYPQAGMALFAGELIFVKVTPDDRHTVPLFPYIGPQYKKSDYEAIASFYPHLRRYAVDPKNCARKIDDRSKTQDTDGWVVAGTPHQDFNLAGYISRMDNSHQWEANCRLEEINRPARKVDDPWAPYSRDHDRKAYPFLDKLNSCQNPKYMNNYVMAVARRPIHVGEELFIDLPFVK
ncbi:unnamed protein product [Calypogeia fissa]